MTPSLARSFISSVIVLLAACGPSAPPRSGAEDAPFAEDVATVPESQAPFGPVVTPSGGRVSISLPEGEIRAGDLTVTIVVDGLSAGQRPHSVDVMSPTMPMHGVLRIPVEETAPGTFVATAPIAMEGRWALFVNLDEDGAESAEFQFDALPAPPRPAAGQQMAAAHVH